ncbi:MAG TPA: DegT/DnrJ/EryC1/StrS family aminotransferase [Terriglobia bacterium]|nr:DegT/DnrJ/EryC1/StrS family aminotransferase [Terriglobia bacterium]
MSTASMPVTSPASEGVQVRTQTTRKPFPFLNLKAQYAEIETSVRDALDRVLSSQVFILGEEVNAFEAEMASVIDAPHAIGCASGSDALLLSLMALEVGPGDEVITTPFTFVATVGAVVRLGARPVFVDIDSATFNIDSSQLDAAVSARTRAIIPVHLFGLAADMDRVMEIATTKNIPVVEDAAQAIGARYRGRTVGSFGATGCFSFFPSKNLGGAGDGGLITTASRALAERLRLLRAHGAKTKYHYDLVGINSRLDSLQAAILRAKLPHLHRWSESRIDNAGRYRRFFADAGLLDVITLPTSSAGSVHVYNQFTIRTRERDRLRDFLKDRGIPSEIYYPVPLHLQRAFEFLGYKQDQFPKAESASREVLSLPIGPTLQPQQQAEVVEVIAGFYGR